MSGNPVQIRRLYFIYTYIGLALCVLAGNLVSYEVPLRAGLSMDQFGFVIGLGQILPAMANILTAPLVTRYRLEYWSVVVMPLIRYVLGTGFVLLAIATKDLYLLTIGFSVIYVMYMVCPYVSSNALQSVIKRVIPEDELGKQTSKLLLWQYIPGTLMAIALTFLIEKWDDKSPDLFYKLVLGGLAVTLPFQIACSVVAYRMMKTEEKEASEAQNSEGASEPASEQKPEEPVKLEGPVGAKRGGVLGWISAEVVGPIIPPFVDARFVHWMRQYFVVAVVTGMSQGYVFPFFTRAMGWTLVEFQTLSAVMVCLGMVFMPAWGALADKIGGRNVGQASQMVYGVTLLILATGTQWGLWVYVLVGFYGIYGLVGSGVTIGTQYLMVSFADKRQTAVYIAAFTLVAGGGSFLGFWLGGVLLEWLKMKVPGIYHGQVHYEVYFMICGVGHLISGWALGGLPDVKPALTRAEVGYELMMTLLKTFRLHRP